MDLRQLFPHELDFSRWLADNIQVLKDLVCFDIDQYTVSQEVTSSSIRVDLMAQARWPNEDESFPVIIENQLGVTDASHCAGIRAYTAAFKARAAIWIAESVTQAYVDVVEWLNAESNLDAYLLVVECLNLKIDESRPYPFLTRLAGPLRKTDTRDEATRCYDLIMERKAEIESSFGLELDLSTKYRRGGTVFIRAQGFDGGYASEAPTQEKATDSIAESMQRLCIATDSAFTIGRNP